MKESRSERYIREYEEAGDNVEKALAEVKRVFYETPIGKRLEPISSETWLKIGMASAAIYLLLTIIFMILEG